MSVPPGSPQEATKDARDGRQEGSRLDDSRLAGWRQEAWRLEEWVGRYGSMVYSLCLRMTGDGSWAEELTQDVFVDLDGNRERMIDEQHVRRWLRQVAMHRAVDGLRRRNSREPGWQQGRVVSLEDWQETATSEGGMGRSAEIERWLLELPERQREAVLLRYQESMTPEEIAEALRAPVATVKSHLQRGLKTLRRLAGVERTSMGSPSGRKEMSDAE